MARRGGFPGGGMPQFNEAGSEDAEADGRSSGKS